MNNDDSIDLRHPAHGPAAAGRNSVAAGRDATVNSTQTSSHASVNAQSTYQGDAFQHLKEAIQKTHDAEIEMLTNNFNAHIGQLENELNAKELHIKEAKKKDRKITLLVREKSDLQELLSQKDGQIAALQQHSQEQAVEIDDYKNRLHGLAGTFSSLAEVIAAGALRLARSSKRHIALAVAAALLLVIAGWTTAKLTSGQSQKVEAATNTLSVLDRPVLAGETFETMDCGTGKHVVILGTVTPKAFQRSGHAGMLATHARLMDDAKTSNLSTSKVHLSRYTDSCNAGQGHLSSTEKATDAIFLWAGPFSSVEQAATWRSQLPTSWHVGKDPNSKAYIYPSQ